MEPPPTSFGVRGAVIGRTGWGVVCEVFESFLHIILAIYYLYSHVHRSMKIDAPISSYSAFETQSC